MTIDSRDRLVQEAVTEKVCTKCKRAKPLKEFSKNSSSRDKLSYWCRGCQSSYGKALAAQKKAERLVEEQAEEAKAALNGHALEVSLEPETPAQMWRRKHPPQEKTPKPQPRTQKDKVNDVLTMVSLLLDMPEQERGAVLRMVAAYDSKGGAE